MYLYCTVYCTELTLSLLFTAIKAIGEEFLIQLEDIRWQQKWTFVLIMRNGNHFYHLNTIRKSFDETFKCFYVSRLFIFFVYIFLCPEFLLEQNLRRNLKKIDSAQDDPVRPPQAQSWIKPLRVTFWFDEIWLNNFLWKMH